MNKEHWTFWIFIISLCVIPFIIIAMWNKHRKEQFLKNGKYTVGTITRFSVAESSYIYYRYEVNDHIFEGNSSGSAKGSEIGDKVFIMYLKNKNSESILISRVPKGLIYDFDTMQIREKDVERGF